jgi:hypothetical protein
MPASIFAYQPGWAAMRFLIAANSAISSSLVGWAMTDGFSSRLAAEDQQQRGIAAVVENHVRALAIGPLEDAVGVVPVLFEALALVGEHRRAAGGDGGGGVVLRREDVAGGPAHVGAERLQALDQHRRLDGHVQAAGDARAAQRLGGGEFLAHGHQAGHLGLGDGDFLAAPFGEGDVGDLVVGKAGNGFGCCVSCLAPCQSSRGDGGGCSHSPAIP